MMGIVIAVASCALGCGSVAATVDADPNAPDARIDAPPGTPDAAVPCDPSRPFGAAAQVAGVNSAQDELSFRISADELGAYLSRTDPAGMSAQVYATTRSGPAAAFAPPTLLGGPVNMADADNPNVSPDGLSLVFSTVQFGSYDIAVATRTGAQFDFTAPMMISSIDTTSVELDPYLLHAGDALYFTRVSGATGGVPMLVSRITTLGGFGSPTVVPGLTLAVSPVVSEDELEVFIAQNQQIYRSSRATPADAFVAPNQVGELMSASGDNRPTALSADGCTLYFSSTRPGGAGGWDIWAASRRP